MRRVLITISLALFLAFLPASTVLAEDGEPNGPGFGPMHRGGPEGGRPSPAGMILRLQEKLELELTDEQVAELEVIEEKAKAANDIVKTKRESLSEAVKTGASEDLIRSAATEVGNAIGDCAVLQAGSESEIDAILTETQKSKLDEFKQNHDPKTHQPETDDSTGERGPQAMFDSIDSDSDGVISFEEFQNHSEHMRNRMRHHGPHGGR